MATDICVSGIGDDNLRHSRGQNLMWVLPTLILALFLVGCLHGRVNYADYQSAIIEMRGSGASAHSDTPLTSITVDIAKLRDSGRVLEFKLFAIGRNETPTWRIMNSIDVEELVTDGWQPQPTRGNPAIDELYQKAGVAIGFKNEEAAFFWTRYSTDFAERSLEFRESGQTRVVRLPMSKTDADYLSGEVGKLVLNSIQ